MSSDVPDREGVRFRPVDGRVSTTATAKHILATAHDAVDPDLAAAIRCEEDWRHRYPAYLCRVTALAARDAAAGLTAARVGLEAAAGSFSFTDASGTRDLAEAVRDGGATAPAMRTHEGGGARAERLEVPYGREVLHGDALKRRLDAWESRGAVEPAFAEAVRRVVDSPSLLDLRDATVALLGAGAELSPAAPLLRWGATVAAVDLPRPRIWQRLRAFAAAGAGRLLHPVRPGGDEGLDLLVEAPAARAWLGSLDGPLVLGNYGYADGERFVRVSMAIDAITAALLDERSDTSLAHLATPTDVYAVGAHCVSAATGRRRGVAGRLTGLACLATRGRAFVPSYRQLVETAAGPVGIVDSLILQQGPNYALAKRLQRWRAAVARADGHVSSVHVAPPTRTVSVVRNPALAAAYDGAGLFGVTVFPPATTLALMSAVLVHDLRDPSSAAHPGTGPDSVEHLLFAEAAHGGIWHAGWEPRTAFGLAAALGAPRALARRALPKR